MIEKEENMTDKFETMNDYCVQLEDGADGRCYRHNRPLTECRAKSLENMSIEDLAKSISKSVKTLTEENTRLRNAVEFAKIIIDTEPEHSELLRRAGIK